MSSEADPRILAAEAEIHRLEQELEKRRDALAWFTQLGAESAPIQAKAQKRRRSRLGPVQVKNGRETWPSRIGRVLSEAAPERVPVSSIVETLLAEGVFAGVNMDPANLIRANLKRCADKRGWQSEVRHGTGYWGLVATSETGGPDA